MALELNLKSIRIIKLERSAFFLKEKGGGVDLEEREDGGGTERSEERGDCSQELLYERIKKNH